MSHLRDVEDDSDSSLSETNGRSHLSAFRKKNMDDDYTDSEMSDGEDPGSGMEEDMSDELIDDMMGDMVEIIDLSEDEVDVKPATSMANDEPPSINSRSEDHVGQLYNGNRRSGDYYMENMRRFDDKRFRKKTYAVKTERALTAVLYTWRSSVTASPFSKVTADQARFCRHALQQPWRRCMKQIDLGMLHSFFEFHLHQAKARDGRRKRPVKITRSMQTFWNNFTLVYRREMLSDPYYRLDKGAVHNLLADLNTNFRLSARKRSNRPMTLDDLRLQVETTLSTTEKDFKLGEQRILAVLFLLLLAPAGSRPNAILEIKLGDIHIGLHQPRKGPAQLLIGISLETTKAYMGPKGVNTFWIPEVIYDPSLFLSPHVFLLAILFRRRAFRVDELNDNPSMLMDLKVLEKEKTMPLPLRKSMLNEYLFRATEKNENGYSLSQQRVTKDAIHSSLLRIGRILGWEGNATAYTLRYAAGNNMNQNVDISMELQNLVMGHAPNSATFQTNYLNRNITFDLWALQRGLEPQNDIVREATSFGYHRSARRPMGLSPAETEALKGDPEYKYYEKLVSKLKAGTEEYVKARKELKKAHGRLRYAAIQKTIGRDWTEQQAVEDITQQITQQITGRAPRRRKPASTHAQLRKGQRPPRPMSALQQAMLDALYQPMNTTIEQQLQRRGAAIQALITYCGVQEPLMTRFVVEAEDTTFSMPSDSAEREAELSRLRRSAFVQYEEQKLLTCYMCVAKALTLPPLDPNVRKLCHAYSSPSAIGKHFRTAHLRFMEKKSQLDPCPICIPKVTFKTIMQLKNHARLVHGIIQRAPE